MINLTKLEVDRPWRYRMDVLEPGGFAGHCKLYEDRLLAQSDHMSPLQSWAPELRNFRRMTSRLQKSEHCDIFMERPTFVVKIDAGKRVSDYFIVLDILVIPVTNNWPILVAQPTAAKASIFVQKHGFQRKNPLYSQCGKLHWPLQLLYYALLFISLYKQN